MSRYFKHKLLGKILLEDQNLKKKIQEKVDKIWEEYILLPKDFINRMKMMFDENYIKRLLPNAKNIYKILLYKFALSDILDSNVPNWELKRIKNKYNELNERYHLEDLGIMLDNLIFIAVDYYRRPKIKLNGLKKEKSEMDNMNYIEIYYPELYDLVNNYKGLLEVCELDEKVEDAINQKIGEINFSEMLYFAKVDLGMNKESLLNLYNYFQSPELIKTV